MRTTNIIEGGVALRALESEDLDLIYVWENDPSQWVHSLTRVPYSRYQLNQFIESQSQDIGADGQLRLVVCRAEVGEFRDEEIVQCGDAVGMVDIFEYDPYNHRAGVGIYIDPASRGRGYASAALVAVERYLVENFELHQLWCNISEDNAASLKLFVKCGYSKIGTKREWCRRGGIYIDELFFQKIITTK